jgi:hypothetical protein
MAFPIPIGDLTAPLAFKASSLDPLERLLRIESLWLLSGVSEV